MRLIEFGFPLDFKCPLRCEAAIMVLLLKTPTILMYILRKNVVSMQYWVCLNPLLYWGAHNSPIMTRHKPNSEYRRDLNWPLGASLNAGIDKQTYLGSEFDLTFSSVDNITDELK